MESIGILGIVGSLRSDFYNRGVMNAAQGLAFDRDTPNRYVIKFDLQNGRLQLAKSGYAPHFSTYPTFSTGV